MDAWSLPKSAEINGTRYEIRSDFRAALDIIRILEDVELSDAERGFFACQIFYIDFDEMPRSDYQDAADFLQWFIGGGDRKTSKPKRKLIDWVDDFGLIVSPVNRILGYDARSADYVHWWTFLGAYMEIGDCLLAQVVSIRKKLKTGKKLEKFEREFYRENRELVDFSEPELTDAEKEILAAWM